MLPIDNKVIIFLYRRSRTFFTANGGLFAFAAFQPAIGEGTEKLKPTIKLKVDDGEIAVLPFIICLF